MKIRTCFITYSVSQKKGYPLKSSASAACSNLNAFNSPISSRMRKSIRNKKLHKTSQLFMFYAFLGSLGSSISLSHSDPNMRHWLDFKGWPFFLGHSVNSLVTPMISFVFFHEFLLCFTNTRAGENVARALVHTG